MKINSAKRVRWTYSAYVRCLEMWILVATGILAHVAGAAAQAGSELAPSLTTTPSKIEWRIGQELLVLQSEPRFAGAISSIRLGDVEYIDATDHGRLLSGAIQFDGWGECLNPTLPGSLADKEGTSSILLSARANSSSYESSTRMGFWMPPSAPHHVNPMTGQLDFTQPQACERPPADQAQRTAVNDTVTSNVIYTQKMSAGFQNIANAILDEISFEVQEDHPKAIVEALTGYMPSKFSEFYRYDGAARAFLHDGEVTLHPGEQSAPIIVATPDGTSALGVLSLTREPAPRYGRWVLSTVSKWNIVFRPKGTFPKGRHVYRCVWAIGTLAEVQASLVQIMEHTTSNLAP